MVSILGCELPELLAFGGNWESYVEELHAVFRADFVTECPKFEGLRVNIRKAPMSLNKENAFWHLTHSGSKDEEERTPDLERCRRLGWIRSMIEQAQDGVLAVWNSPRGTEKGVVIAVPDFSYAVVLAERDGYFLLKTAFYVEQEHRRKKLQKEWSEARRYP